MHDRLRTRGQKDHRSVAARPRDVALIMPTTSWTGFFEPCARRALERIDESSCDAELVVVLDGEPTPPPEWLLRHDVRIVSTGRRSGPAVARNRAAESARAEILMFVDADVELGHGAIDRVRDRFRADSGLAGMFGAYDDEPAAPGTTSQFRNLLHHHTHVINGGPAVTFWAGCGAMRAERFRAIGGFDGRYRHPSIEDIELGSRLSAAGGRIEIDPDLRCKHHKRWTFRSMVYTDVARRAVPWTRLMLHNRRMPASLAIDWRNRASGILASLGVAAAVAAAILAPWLWLAAAACAAGVFGLNARFYRLCRRKRGVSFAAACFALHYLFFVYSTVAFAAASAHALFAPAPTAEDPGGPRTAEERRPIAAEATP